MGAACGRGLHGGSGVERHCLGQGGVDPHPWKDYIVRPVVPLGAMSLYLLLVAHGLEALLTDSFGTLNRAVYTALGLVSVAGGGLIYMLTILRFGGITREGNAYVFPIGTQKS